VINTDYTVALFAGWAFVPLIISGSDVGPEAHYKLTFKIISLASLIDLNRAVDEFGAI